MKGLICIVYHAAGRIDCTNNGISSKCERVVLIGEGIPEIFEPTDAMPALYLTTGPHGMRASTTPDYYSGMFGGNFLYSSDARFPGHNPIRIFDRFEE